MLTSNLNATRFAQKPLYQPSYSFAHVPRAERDLKHSCLQYVEGRDDFHQTMAEMLLMCKEAMRRRPEKKGHGTSKPLSLEYLADRFDVDDPLFGYIVRTEEQPARRGGHWQKGMLQGFVTVTTFTNYQRTFRWDSLHPSAFSYDDETFAQQRLEGVRKWDEDGSIAAGMQATVRCGDIWNEGIVWPRIAEISLLGGLGCGATLVKIVIEHLECMRASAKCNYDYVVLQATDNSISFYESMGFVRVGAVVKDEKVKDSTDDEEEDAVAEPVPHDSPEKPNAVATTCDIVTGPITQYTTKKPGETPNDLAKKLNVNVWDIVFLNKDIYTDICPTSRLLAGTILHIPVYEKPKHNMSPKKQSLRGAEKPVVPQFYTAKEDDTPRMIAKMFNVSCVALVEANKGRLEGLLSSSRLMAGTRVKVSHLDVIEDEFKPYPHWSFPDDSFDDPEPSYMMAYKLDRKRGNNCRFRPVLESLAVQVSKYEPTELVIPPSPGPIDYEVADPPSAAEARSVGKLSPVKNTHKKDRLSSLPGAPRPPKRALCAYMLFAADMREQNSYEIRNMSMTDANKYFGDLWRNLPAKKKAPYESEAVKGRERYFKEKAEYERKLAVFKRNNPEYEENIAPSTSSVTSSSAATVATGMSLYNKVVRLKPGAMTEGSEFTYWYVLTYIPDLKWCHLAPMTPCGVFSDEKSKSKGRTKYKLVDEKLGKEVDISSSFCIPIKARAMKRTLDADKEEWDVVDDGSDPDPDKVDSFTRRGPKSSSRRSQSKRSHRTSTLKPAAVPKFSSKHKYAVDAASRTRLPLILAASPRGKSDVYVRVTGTGICDPNYDYPPSTRKRGRPKGSYGPKRMAALELMYSQKEEEVIIEIVSSKSGSKKRGRPKGSKNKLKASPSEETPRSSAKKPVAPKNSVSRSQRNYSARSGVNSSEPARKRVRLSSPVARPLRNTGEQKENVEPKSGTPTRRLRSLELKPESIDFSNDSITTTRRTSSGKAQAKMSSLASSLLSTTSPRRSPARSSVGPDHKRLRHRQTPEQSVKTKRSQIRSTFESLEDLTVSHSPKLSGKRQSPRFKGKSETTPLQHYPLRSGARGDGGSVDRGHKRAAASSLSTSTPREKRHRLH